MQRIYSQEYNGVEFVHGSSWKLGKRGCLLETIKLKGVNTMSLIEGVRIRNYRALKDVKMGRLWNDQAGVPLSPLTAIIGKNGAGKSSLLDAFGFLSDCLKFGVEEACVRNGRGGFGKIITQGSDGSIAFEIYYREAPQERPITYEVEIGLDDFGRVCVRNERLRQRRSGQTHGRPFSFLILRDGRGFAWKGEAKGFAEKIENVPTEELFKVIRRELKGEEANATEWVELADNRRLGLATLGVLKQHPRISLFRRFMEGWYLSYFRPDSARSLPMEGPQKRLDVHGDNLGNVVQFMKRDYPDRFSQVLSKIAGRIPGIEKIDTETTADGRLLVKFHAKGFSAPFYAQQMSDGTLKFFAYLLMLSMPDRPPFLCIEEPENGLYHKLLALLVGEFRSFANGRKDAPQIFVTTHQPYLVDDLTPSEVWILEKGEDGCSSIRRASDDPIVASLAEQELPLGTLWYSEYLDGEIKG